MTEENHTLSDQTAPLRHLLATVHVETQRAEARLYQLRTEGSDHFKAQHQAELETLTDEGLDDWTAREWARNRVEHRAGHQ